jgi:hypothetical protein
MIGIMEIKAGYEGAKAALDIAKGVSSLKTETAVNAAIIDIQRHVVEAQQGLSTSLQKIDELEKEIVRLKDWSAEKERYELKDTGSGAVAYALKQSVAGGQPAHYLCADCFENGHKAYLHGSHPLSTLNRRSRKDRLEAPAHCERRNLTNGSFIRAPLLTVLVRLVRGLEHPLQRRGCTPFRLLWGVDLSHATDKREIINTDLSYGDLIVLMLEVEEELNGLGAPFDLG